MNHLHKQFELSRFIYRDSPESPDLASENADSSEDTSDADATKKKGDGLFGKLFDDFRRNSADRQAKRQENFKKNQADRRARWAEWRADRGNRVEERRKRMGQFGQLVRDLMSTESPSTPAPKKSPPPEYYAKLIRKELEAKSGRSSNDNNLDNIGLIENLIQDPSLKDMGLIEKEWVHNLVLTNPNMGGLVDILGGDHLLSEKRFEDYYVNAQAIIARNLFFQNKPVNKTNVLEEISRLMDVREKYSEVSIFEGRNVLLATHNEKKESDYYGDLNRFGKKDLVDRIRQDGAKAVEVIRPEETRLSLRQQKGRILERLRDTDSPFTFIFDGHGGPDALYISDGQILNGNIFATENAIKITVEELFDAYVDRKKKYSSSGDPAQKDIFIHAGCFNATFLRSFYELCDQSNIPKPIFAGESEYGQLGYSEYSSRYGEDLFEAMFNYASNSKATLGNLIDNDVRNLNSNPSLYIPDEENRTFQLTENATKKQDVEVVDDQFA